MAEEEKSSVKEFCINFWYGFYLVFYYLYLGIKFIIVTILKTLAFMWYPFKQCGYDCCDCCQRRMNPYRDPAYSTF